jgi:hypothetical protein
MKEVLIHESGQDMHFPGIFLEGICSVICRLSDDRDRVTIGPVSTD